MSRNTHKPNKRTSDNPKRRNVVARDMFDHYGHEVHQPRPKKKPKHKKRMFDDEG